MSSAGHVSGDRRTIVLSWMFHGVYVRNEERSDEVGEWGGSLFGVPRELEA